MPTRQRKRERERSGMENQKECGSARLAGRTTDTGLGPHGWPQSVIGGGGTIDARWEGNRERRD